MNRLRSGLLIALIALVGAGAAMGAFVVEDATSIAPVSIPLDSAGNAESKVGMVRLSIAGDSNRDGPREISELTVTLTGTALTTDIAEIYVYWEDQQGTPVPDGTYDRGTNNEILLGTLTGSGNTWSGNSVVIPLNDNEILKKQAGNGQSFIYIAFDFVASIAADKTAGVQVESIEYGDYNAGGVPTTGLGTLPGPYPAVASNVDLDDYEVTLSGDTAGLGLGVAYPGDTTTVLQLNFGVPDTTLLAAGHPTVNSIRLRQTGTGNENDVSASGIRVYSDDNGSGDFDAGDTVYGTGTLGADGYANITLSSTISLGTSTLQYFVAVDVSSNATEGNTLGFEVETPSTDVGFVDGVVDIQPDGYLATIFANDDVQSFEYDQIGFITSGVATPAAGDTITIEPTPDTTPPTVASTSPSNSASGVDNETTIEVTFSEGMTPFDASAVTITGSESGAIDPATDGTFTFNTTTNQSFTFAKATPYAFSETVAVTVSGTVTDDAAAPNQLDGNGDGAGGDDYTFSFTIEPNLPPTVLGWVPTRDSEDVSVGTTVSVIFSEAMNAATVQDGANFALIADGQTEPVVGVMTYDSDTNTATFTPEEPLEYRTLYTATVATGMRDSDGAGLTASDSASFTTVQQFPDFAEPIVTNNRIQPGSTDPVRIFVTTPTGFSGTEAVSIQVFTSMGRRVATLTTSAETFEEVIARQPVVWDGTNGRGQSLGPGLYFVQVRSGSYRRAMRVVIVR